MMILVSFFFVSLSFQGRNKKNTMEGEDVSSSLDLGSLRQKIDSIDSKLVNLLNDRATVSINIGLAKRQISLTEGLGDEEKERHFHIPLREKAVYERASSLNRGPLTNEAIHAIYREIMSASISLQKEVTIAYLGPRKFSVVSPANLMHTVSGYMTYIFHVQNFFKSGNLLASGGVLEIR